MRKVGAVPRSLVVAVLTALVALTTTAVAPTAVGQPSESGLELAKTASPFAGLVEEDTVTYTFTVTNTGSTPISDLAIEEVEFTGAEEISDITCEAETLAPRGKTTCTATYEVIDVDVEACRIANTAIATGTDPEGAEVESKPASVTVFIDCWDGFPGSGFLPLLGSTELGSFALAPLAVGSFGLGALGALGALGGVGLAALTTPYQPGPAIPCLDLAFLNMPLPELPFLCPVAPAPAGP